MPTKEVHDTVSGTTGTRLPVHKEGSTTHYEYSNGVELTVEKIAEGNGNGLKEVRAVTRAKAPRRYFRIG